MNTPKPTRKATIADAVSEAFGDIEMLAEEMRETFDNTPESLQQSGVGEARGEAADALENISEVDVPDSLAQLDVEWIDAHRPGRRGLSRSKRRDNAVNILQTVISMLDERENDDDAEGLRDDLDNAVSEMEDVQFPGMYG